MKAILRKLILCACLVVSFNAAATEIIHYENIPVTVYLHVGSERSLKFGDHVKVGITKGQQIKKLFRHQSAQGVVHFLPYEEFDKQRVQIKRLTDGRVILLDIIAEKVDTKAIPLEDLRFILESENEVIEEKMVQENDKSKLKVITPVDLTRFAAQRLYGPTRLHKGIPGITEVTLGFDGAIRIFKGINKLKTVSKPVVAYQGGGYYLAGIYIKNIEDHMIQLNYLDLNLSFSHATLQHHKLYPSGTPGDSTILYLISEKPLKEVLYPWSYYQDLRADAEHQISIEKAVKEKEDSSLYRQGFK